MSNGEDMAKAVQGMTLDEKLIFIISELGNLKTVVTSHMAVSSQVVEELSEMKLKVVQLPTHCAHEQDFIKMCTIKTEITGRLSALERDKAGRKAVNKFLFGTSGLSILGLSAVLLKLFGVF